MQFLGREGLDQVVIRRQFCDRDNVVVSAFAGDDEDDGVSGQQMLLAQFFQQLLAIAAPEQAYFWATHAGAELDLLLFKDGRRIGVEIKRSDAPGCTPSALRNSAQA